MAEWLYDAGIGEDRAILLDHGHIVEAAIELPGGVRTGSVFEARLAHILVPGRRGIVDLAGGGEALVEPLPAKLTDGQALRVEIVREALSETSRNKLAMCRVSDAPLRTGPALRERIAATGVQVTTLSAHGPDRLEAAGWSELLEQATSGDVPFAGGSLRISLTPAMTLIDVDGPLPPAELAVAGARAAGEAIRRFGIGGSIGIDLPTIAARTDRQAAASALDAVLPQPFERTAVNGFGFLQVVRRRERASLPELLQGDPTGAATRALLRRAERSAGAGPLTLVAAPVVIARLEAHPEWIDQLRRNVGRAIALRADPALAISAGYVHSSPI